MTILTEVARITRKPNTTAEYDKELKRLKQAISDADQAHRYDGNLVADLLVHMGLIHPAPGSARRWGKDRQ